MREKKEDSQDCRRAGTMPRVGPCASGREESEKIGGETTHDVEELGADAEGAHEDALLVVELEERVGGGGDILVGGGLGDEGRVHLDPVGADVEDNSAEEEAGAGLGGARRGGGEGAQGARRLASSAGVRVGARDGRGHGTEQGAAAGEGRRGGRGEAGGERTG